MGQYVDFYCKEENKNLKKIIDPILFKHFSWIPQKDFDDFYSIGAKVVWDCERRFDEKHEKSFENFLVPCIHNKIKQHVTYMNRDKRMQKDAKGNPIHPISMEKRLNNEEETTISEFLKSSYTIEDEIGELKKKDNVEKYLKNLSNIQRKIVVLKANGYEPNEIKTKLCLTNSEFNSNWKVITSFDNIQNLTCNKNYKVENEEENTDMGNTQTMENCKTDKISVSSINNKIDRRMLRFDYSTQRAADQWTPEMKGNAVSDVLQGNKFHSLIFAEQIINGIAIIWGLDGKQRCTTCYSFVKDGFKVSKKVRRGIIKYQTTKKDEEGKEILDDNGFPIAVIEECDIRGKYFSDLPTELQDKFLEYTFNYDEYLNCTDEDITYHIERYNDGKPMTKSQKGITKLGADKAEWVKSIANMSFFKNKGGYKNSDFNNGSIDRVVVESIMNINYLDDWGKDMGYMCKYLKDNSDISVYENFEELVDRIDAVITEEVEDMFNSTDSFLWFGAFARFLKFGLPDCRFMDFMNDFTEEMQKKEVNGTSFYLLSINPKTGKTRSTKDKYIVAPKMNVLEELMKEYFADELENMEDELEVETINVLDFLRENVDENILEEDIEYYKDDLEVLSLDIDNNTRILDISNTPSLLAMIAYSYKEDKPFDNWFMNYCALNNTYIENQKTNYLHMREDFEHYLEEEVA